MRTFSTFVASTMLGLTAFALPSNAAVLDFIDYIDEVTGETGGDPTVMSNATHVPIATTVTGYGGVDGGIPVLNTSRDVAYLDFGEAGIGVCGELGQAVPLPNKSTNECASGAGDDNLQSGEILGFKWDTGILVNGIGFRPEGHDVDFASGAEFQYSTNGGLNWLIGDLVKYEDETDSGFFTFGTSLFISSGDELLLGWKDTQYYVSGMDVSAVPLPSSALLLGIGIVGMGAMRRKRKQS